jgi:hypothetical protein
MCAVVAVVDGNRLAPGVNVAFPGRGDVNMVADVDGAVGVLGDFEPGDGVGDLVEHVAG